MSKEEENNKLLKAIEAIISAGSYWREPLAIEGTGLQSTNQKVNPFSVLSAKELDVLNFLVQEKNTKEISTLSHLQMSAISTHKIRIFRKLNITNMAELIALAREHQL